MESEDQAGSEPTPDVVPEGMPPLPQPAPRGRRRGVTITVGVALWLAIAGVSAAIAAGGGSGGAAAQAAPSPSGQVATDSASAAPVLPSDSASPSPSPSSTLKGYVSGSTHSGDLRYFLLPVPADAEAYGNTDGTTESLNDIAQQMSNASTSKSILQQFGFTGGATRTYRTNDSQYTVTAVLLHFDSPGHAADWVTGLTFGQGDSFDISGISNAKGVAVNPTDSGGVGSLRGISHVGDVEYEIDIQGTGALDHSLLTPLMQREEKLLSTGH